METEIEFIPAGGVTTPKGFMAGVACAGLKHVPGMCPDMGIIFSEAPCTAAALFTTNQFRAAPVNVSREKLKNNRAAGVVVNSGCANAGTGAAGLADALKMAELAAEHTGLAPDDMLVSSTGVIGERLPIDKIARAIKEIKLSADGGHDMARAIMTTDTVPKEAAVRAGGFVIGGIAKGSGMIHPNMATMLSFLTTDAAVEAAFLKKALKEAADMSFNMITVDGDTSTNDTVLVLANGMSGGELITESSPQAAAFQSALNGICIFLAKAIARDGEGATKLIEINVSGAVTLADARIIARTIASSPLVKTAVYGSDPNWGRVVAAAGRCGVKLEESKLALEIAGIHLLSGGAPQPYDRAELIEMMSRPEVVIDLHLNLGEAAATAWGCDMTGEYVTINSQYTT